VSDPLWAHSPVPGQLSAQALLWSADPSGPADLSRLRSRLRAAVRAAVVVAEEDDALEALLLVVEELTSNALRHGHPPVHVTVHAHTGGWLLSVTDAAVDTPPTPAVDRDPAAGGLGLYMVARLAGGHGWSTSGAAKTAWALVPDARAATVRRPTSVRSPALPGT
jgi:anti-sigma regulatory factor (Ser/Thr protein kinase)